MRLATIAWRGLAARPLRTALAVIGIALGVAVVAATVVTGASSDRALRAATVDLLGAADVRFRAFDETGFTPRSVQSVRAMPEVVAAAPVAERRLMAFTAPGEDERVFTITVLGIDPQVDALVRQPRLVAGVAVSAANATDAVVPAALARRYGLALGDELSLNGRREGVPPLRIVGIAADTGLAALDDGEVLLISRATFDESFDAPAPIRSLDVDLGEAPGEDARSARSTSTLARRPARTRSVASRLPWTSRTSSRRPTRRPPGWARRRPPSGASPCSSASWRWWSAPSWWPTPWPSPSASAPASSACCGPPAPRHGR